MMRFTHPDGRRLQVNDDLTVVERVRTADLWQHIGREVQYTSDEGPAWSRLIAVRDSEYQGWAVVLEACELQSCWPDSTYDLR